MDALTNRTVFKFPIRFTGAIFALDGKRVHRFVHLGRDQSGEVCFWVEVVDSEANVAGYIQQIVCGTGQNIPDNYAHIGTYLDDDGVHVWHVYCRSTYKGVAHGSVS